MCVTVVINPKPLSPADLRVEPATLSQTFDYGATNTVNKSVTVYNDGEQALNWEAYDTGSKPSWLSIGTSSGSNLGGGKSTGITYTINPRNISTQAHTYTYTVKYRNKDNHNDTDSVLVTVTIKPQPADLQVDPAEIIVNVTYRSTTTETRQVTVSNIGGSSLNWRVTNASSAPAWLNVGQTSGTGVQNDKPAGITYVIKPSSISEQANSTHEFRVNYVNADNANDTDSVLVRVIISARPADLQVDPATITINLTYGQTTTATGIVTVSNVGDGLLSWLVTNTGSVPSWLNVGSTSGANVVNGNPQQVQYRIFSAQLSGTPNATYQFRVYYQNRNNAADADSVLVIVNVGSSPLKLISPKTGDVWYLDGGPTWTIKWTGGTGKNVRLLYKVKDHTVLTDPSHTYSRKAGAGDRGWRVVPGASSLSNANRGGTYIWTASKPDGNGVRNSSQYATPFSNQVVMRVEEIEGSNPIGVSSMYDESGNFTMRAPSVSFRVNNTSGSSGQIVKVSMTVSNAATGPKGYWDVTRMHDVRLTWDSTKVALTGQQVSNASYFNYYKDTSNSLIIETPIGKAETSTIPNGTVITLTFKMLASTGTNVRFDTSRVGVFRVYDVSGSSYTTQQLGSGEVSYS